MLATTESVNLDGVEEVGEYVGFWGGGGVLDHFDCGEFGAC